MGVVLIWIVFAVIGGMIGSSKGKTGSGVALGLLLGPLGVIIALLMKADTEKVESLAIESGESKKCPFCSELIKSDAKVCRYCGRDIDVDTSAVQSDPSQKLIDRYSGMEDHVLSIRYRDREQYSPEERAAIESEYERRNLGQDGS